MANIDIKVSPQNLLKWSNFEDWENGASAAPTEHTLTGAGASVARESTTIKQGTYSMAVTRSGADTDVYHGFPDYLDYAGRKMTFGMWVYATVASRARIAIDDGIQSQANSSYHSGGSSWEFLTVTLNTSVCATQMNVICEVNTGDTTAYFDGGILTQGDVAITVLSDIADISDFSPSNRYRGQSHDVTRRDGNLMPNLILDSKTISIEGLIVGSTPTAARTTLDSLVKIINSPRVDPSLDREPRDLYLFDDRFYRGHIDNFSHDSKAAVKAREFKFRFIAPEPYEQYVQYLRTTQSLSSSPQQFTVTTNGNAFCRPIITITNNGSNVASIIVQNYTTNRSFSYTGTLQTSQDLVVDVDKVTVENNGADDIANSSGAISDFILYPGGNEIVVTGILNGTIKVDWRDRWYS